ncbi:hypothetical protein HKD37_02G003976 [Glycine soja]
MKVAGVSPYFRRAKICSKYALDVVSSFEAYYRARVWSGPARIEKRGESLRRNSQVQRSIYEVQSQDKKEDFELLGNSNWCMDESKSR